MRLYGPRNEKLHNLCQTKTITASLGFYPPNRDILPETKKELKEFTRNLEGKTKRR